MSALSLDAVVQAAATIVAAKIGARDAHGSAPITHDELIKELARARDAVWASLKVPQKE